MFSRIRVPLNTSGYRIESTLHKDALETVIYNKIYIAQPLEGDWVNSKLILKHIPLKLFPINMDRNSFSLSGITHENLLTTMEYFYENDDLWIVMPYFESISLSKLLKLEYPNGITDKTLLAAILTSVAAALNRVHYNSSSLKCLKPSKVLINSEGCIKILDCDISGKIREELCRKNILGPYWTAPEVINGASSDMKSDIWSYGLLIIEILTGKNPWEKYPYLKTSIMITEKIPPQIEKHVECESFLKEIVNFCCQKDAQKRPTTSILLANGYFKKKNSGKSVSVALARVFNLHEKKDRKIEILPQPKQLVGEDPNEMLASNGDDELP